MESSDNKTPRAVSGRPSLLNTPAGTAAAKHSPTRMLDSLERDGKSAGSVSGRSTPSRKKYGIAAIAVALCAGIGALIAFGSSDDASATMAIAPPARVTPVTAQVHPASAAVAAAASAAASAQIELLAASAPALASASASAPSATIASAELALASAPHANPLDKLASNEGEPAPAPVVAAARPSSKDKPHVKGSPPVGAHPEAVASAKPAGPHPDAKAAAPRKARRAEDDADTELVAAVIARLDKRGADPVPVATAPAKGNANAANVEGQVRQCSSNSDLLEARQCRNRACEGHWGKLDACPASRAPRSSRSDGAVNGQPG